MLTGDGQSTEQGAASPPLSIALETSQRQASVAVRSGADSLEHQLDGARAHASDCVGLLDDLIARLGRRPAEISAVFVGTGPGSYTGLRIGIGTALGIVRGTGADLRGEPSGEALAWRELEPGEECVVVADARQEELYFAHYGRRLDDVEVIVEPCLIEPDELRARVPGEAWILGERELLVSCGAPAEWDRRMRTCAPPSAADLLQLAEGRLARLGGHARDQVLPLYLRPFRAKTRRR